MFNNSQNYHALYDTGASASLINYSAYVALGKNLDTGYLPFVKNASGEDMGAFGQVTFTINDQPFTQPLTHGMTNHIGNRFYIHKFHGHHLDP